MTLKERNLSTPSETRDEFIRNRLWKATSKGQSIRETLGEAYPTYEQLILAIVDLRATPYSNQKKEIEPRLKELKNQLKAQGAPPVIIRGAVRKATSLYLVYIENGNVNNIKKP